MGWDRGKYYSRSKKVNGRVVREYVGTGPEAELAARIDALARFRRVAARLAWYARRAELDALDSPLCDLDELAGLVAEAALYIAGYHQRKRNEWRKQRVPQSETD